MNQTKGRKKVLLKRISAPAGEYSVGKFYEHEEKLFECIPDIWFVDENRDECFWPPKSKKSVTLRAISYEEPDRELWERFACVVISEGHPTYSSGSLIARDKAAQKYNTSSADEHLAIATFRRKHPGLISNSTGSFENIFHKADAVESQIQIIESQSIQPIHQAEISYEDVTPPAKSDVRVISSVTLQSNGRSGSNSRDSNLRYLRSRSRSRSKSPCPSRSRSRTKTRSRSKSSRTTSYSGRSRSKSSCPSSTGRCRSKSSRPPSNGRSRSRTKTRSRSKSSCPSRSRSRTKTRSRSKSNRTTSSYSGRSRSKSSCRSSTGRSRSKSSRPPSNGRSRSRMKARSRSKYRLNSKSNHKSRAHSRCDSSRCRSASNTRRRYSGSKDVSNSNRSYGQSKSLPKHSSDLQSMKQHNDRYRAQLPSGGSTSASLTTPNVVTSRDLLNAINNIKASIDENNQRLSDNDRRMNRMEVVINKVFLMVKESVNFNAPIELTESKNDNPHKFELPRIPVMSIKELTVLNAKLKSRSFRTFLVGHQKEFCIPSRTTSDTVVITAYLKKFISLDVRCSITLKEPKEEDGLTLCGHFRYVYLYLLDVVKAGYQMANKKITENECHVAIRIVWGRSNQLKNDQDKRRRKRAKQSKPSKHSKKK